MIIRDYHGWLPSDAEADVHRVVGEVRQKNPPMESAEFIVGMGGPVRDRVNMALAENGLKAEAKMGNAGVLVVVIE